MKIRITMKDPDGPYGCIRSAVRDSLPEGLSPGEAEALEEVRTEEVGAAVKKWLRYGEYVEIEIDAEADTATVVRPGG